MVDACIILADHSDALVELCGISILERLLRTLQRCQITRAIILSSTADVIAREVARPSWARAQVEVTVRSREPGMVTMKQIVDAWPKPSQLLLIVRGDIVFDIRLLRLLATQTKSAVMIDSGSETEKFCGAAVVDYQWAVTQTGPFEATLLKDVATQQVAAVDVAALPSYSPEMRRDLRPYWFPAPSPPGKKMAERLLLRSAQKGTPDFPAWVHAPIENFLIARLCKTPITPNQLTAFCNVVAWIATILFATGRVGWGIALALIVGVLDGLDGKQARIKVETTKRGKLEHWFDTVFEWSWWIALAYHFQNSGQLPDAFRYLALLLFAEAIDALAKGSVLLYFGRLIDELGPFDRFVRLIGGRRNIYIVILVIGILFGHAAKSFAVMAWWEAVTAAVHVARAGWEIGIKRYAASLSRKPS
jgi:phosphatidylglycerophosphate synthase